MVNEDLFRLAAERRRQREEERRQGAQRLRVATSPTKSEKQEEKKGSRFGFIADAIRDVVPQEVRDVAGAAAQDAVRGYGRLQQGSLGFFTGDDPTESARQLVAGLRGEEEFSAQDVGFARQLPEGSKAREVAGVAGGVLVDPLTLATAGAGPYIAGGLRALGPGGRLAASIMAPVSSSPSVSTRLFSEVALGTGSTLAAEEAAERGAPIPVVMAAGLAGGVGGLWVGGATRGAGKTLLRDAAAPFRRDSARAIAQEYGHNIGNRTFVADMLPFDEVLAEVRGPTNAFEETGVGRVINDRINPSKNTDSDLGPIYNTFVRQSRRGQQLADVAASAALDPHERLAPLLGPSRAGGRVFNIDADGTIKNLRPRIAGTSTHWSDVFSTPDAPAKYTMSKQQAAYYQDFRQALDEVDDLLTANGLQRYKTKPTDTLYVPRIVRGVKGVDIERPTNARLTRVFETAEDGVRAGISYENDPKAVLALYTEAAYREVAGKQLDDAMAPYIVSPKNVLNKTNPAVIDRVVKAAKDLRGTRTEVRQERRAAIKAGGTKIRSELGPAITPVSQAKLQAAQTEWHAARNQYTRALESTRNKEVLPEYIFGGNSDKLMRVARWKGSFLPESADYMKLAERVDTMTGRQIPAKIDPFSKGMENVGSTIRFASAVGDLAMPFIQGLPLMGQNPLLWAKMAVKHYHSFLNPQFAGKYIRDNIETMQEMAQHGIPIGDVEVFKAADAGILQRGVRTAPGRQTIGRLQKAYDTGLTANRALLWKSLKPAWDGTPEELATYVRNMTGALDSAALGVGPTQRAIESVWLGFSPRLMRSTMALAVKAGNPNSAVGQQAARSLLGLATFAAGMFVSANIGIGMYKGESEEEIKERIAKSLNPLSGGDFMSIDINGQRIGVGGQVRAITQFAAKAMANPAGFATADQFENPLINFYMSRGAVGVNIAGGFVEGATGEKVNVLPFESIDSIPDAVLHVGKSSLPFVVQAQMEAEHASGLDRLAMGAVGFGGLNFKEETASRQIERLSTEQYDRPYSELTGVEQQRFEAEHAELFELRDRQRAEMGGREERIKRQKMAEVDETRIGGERMLVDAYQRGDITGAQFRDEMKAIQRIAFENKRLLRGDEEYETTDENKLALTAWYNTFDEARIEGTEIVDWDAQEALERELFSHMTVEQRRFVEQRRKTEHAQEAEWYFANESIISSSGYWDAADRAFERFAGRMPAGVESYGQLVLAMNQAEKAGDRRTATRLSRLRARVDSISGREKERMRRRDPLLDDALFQNGRVTKRLARQRA